MIAARASERAADLLNGKPVPTPATYRMSWSSFGLSWERRGNLRSLISRTLLFLAAYSAAAQVGLLFATIHGNVSPVWPASAVALSGLLVLGPGFSPVLWIAAFVNMFSTGVSLLTAIVGASGVTLGAFAGAYALRRQDFRPQLERIRDFVALCLVGGVTASAVNAAVGVFSLAIGGVLAGARSLRAFEVWFTGDAFGILLLAPFLLSAWSRPFRLPSWQRAGEASILALSTVAAMLIAGGQQDGYPYLPFLCLIWSVVRFDLRVTSALVAISSGFAIVLVGAGDWSLVAPQGPHPLFGLYRFIVVFGIAGPLFSVLSEENRRVHRRVREIAARYEDVFRQSPLAKAAISKTGGMIVEVNHAFTRLFGWEPDEVRGQPVAELGIWPHGSEAELARRSLDRGDEGAFEATLRARDGREVDTLVSTATMTTAGEGQRLAVFQDLSKIRELEQQVIQAQRMESLGQLAGGVAHDFNNLLSIIIGYAEMLSDSMPPDAPRRAEVDEILKAGHRSADLTRQLLAFSRRQALELEAIDVGVAIGEMRRMLERLIGENVRLSTRIAPDLERVRADRGQFDQILMNLVVNARDAMPAGGELEIEALNRDPDADDGGAAVGMCAGRCVLVRVRDTGLGMNEEVRRRLFEPFFTTKGPGKGTGLGLSVVHGIVRQLGGEIEVRSEPGEGTCFEICLPASAGAPARPAPSAAISRPQEKSGLVLLVEDEPALRRILATTLAGLGCRVLAASGVQGALEAASASSETLDLLISDVVLADGSGRDLATRLQKNYPAIRVLFISGYPDDEVVAHGARSEAAIYLQKPFRLSRFATTVAGIIGSAER